MVKHVVVGSDEQYPIAKFIVKHLEDKGFKVTVVGALKTGKSEPWPIVGYEVGQMVSRKGADTGIVICYTGTGVSIAANKVKGVRAALVFDPYTARAARLWNDANVLALSARWTSEEIAKEILEEWFKIESPDPTELENIRKLISLDR